MVPGSRRPSGLGMASVAGSWKLGCRMRRIVCLVVVDQVTTDAGIGGIDITPLMACKAIGSDGGMCPGEGINSVMIEVGWNPCGLRMTCFAGRGEVGGYVVWIGRLVVLVGMATQTCFRRVGVISIVTGCTIVFNGNMRACQYIVIVVNWEGGWLPSGDRCMTGFAYSRNIDRCVVRIGGCRIILSVAAIAFCRSSRIAMGVAFDTIGGEMCTC